MKAEELMIGDWVFIKDYPIKALPQKVRPEHFVRSLVEFEPIPLTPEILERNGFLANKHVYPYPYYEYEVKEIKLIIGFAFPQGNKTSYKKPWVCIDTECVYIEHLPCMFVHQLQHALRLCGIEKEIEL